MGQVIVGRRAELEAVRGLVADALIGRGGALALVGAPGLGKSTMLDDAEASSAGAAQVLRVRGVELEYDLPFAGLSTLAAPLLEHRECLTGMQGQAVDVAMGRIVGPAPGRMVLGGAVVALLSARADRRPLLVLVDDLQWIDRPSAETILFAARRLQAERVAVVVTSRPPEDPDTENQRRLLRSIRVLELTGLPPTECHRLLPGLAAEVSTALADRTGGNPLAMLEAAAHLGADARAGVRRLPPTLPVTSALDTYRRGLTALTPAAREGGRVLAYAGLAPTDLVVGALAKFSISLLDLEPFEQTGLARLTSDGVEWRHPLARSAAAEGTVEQVRRVHAVLAECWASVSGSRPQWAWHMAEAVSGPDQEVADALAAVAAVSAGRDASLEAADAWERAAQLSESPDTHSEWLHLAARAAFRGGAAARAAHLYDLALEPRSGNADAEARAVVLHERGRVEHGLGRPSIAFSLLMDAAGSGDRRRRVWAAAEAVFAGMYAKRPDLATRAAAPAVAAHDPDDPEQRYLALHAEAAAASLAGDAATARERMATVNRLLLDERLLEREPGLLLWAVNADFFADGPIPPLQPYVQDAVGRMRESGELMWSPRVVRLVGLRDYSRGSWDRAYGAFDEATELSRLSGQSTQVAEGLLLRARVEAARGERRPCWEHTEEAGGIVERLEVRWLADEVWSTRGLLHLTLDEPGPAVTCFSRCPDSSAEATAGLVEALVRSGRRAAAQEVLDSRPGEDQMLFMAQRLVDDDVAAAHDILGHVDDLEPFEAARWRSAAGSILRRAGARREARHQLRLAEEVFAGLGATPWRERVRSELRASGATLRRGPEAQALSAGELRVASLVAQGRSNKEVAAALFLSTKTVEFHLGRAFRKLGVKNRTALAARLAEVDAG